MPIQTAPVAEPKLPVIQVADGKTAQVIGKVSAIQGDAWIVRGGQKIAATAEAPLIKGDSVESADGSQISLVFADRSTFVLKDKGLIGLDDFTYDPATKTGSESILVAQGGFSFVSGDIAKSAPGAAKVATPAMSIGIRGTTVVGAVGEGGETSVALQPDPGSSFVGEITLSRPGSGDAPLTISTPGAGVLGATPGASFTIANNAGAAISSVVPAPSAPQATPPSLPSAAPTGGGEGGGAGTSGNGGGDTGNGGTGNPGGSGGEPVGDGNPGGGDVGGGDTDGGDIEVPPLPAKSVVGDSNDGGQTGDSDGGGTDTGGGSGNNGNNGAGGGEVGLGDTGNGDTGNTAIPVVTTPPVNQPPTSAGLTLSAANEDGGSVTILKADLLAAASDPEGATLTLVGGITASAGTLVDNGDGTLTLTPAADFFGDITISYSVSDGTNTASLTATQPITNVNDAPVPGSVTLPTGTEDTVLTFTTAQLVGSTTDVDGDTLTVTGISAIHGTVVDSGGGVFTYTPDANYNGTDFLNYSITDGNGGTVAVSATFTVNSVNDAPTMGTYVGQNSSTEDVPYAGDTVYTLFSGTFSDTDSTDTLAGVAVISNPFTADGAWQYSSDGGTTWRDISGVNIANAQLLSYTTLVRFLPSADFNGTTPSLYVYGVDSSYAGSWSNSTTNTPATINASSPGGSSPLSATSTQLETAVNAVNDAPTSTTVTLAGGVEDMPYSFTQAELLANASDVDGDSLGISAITASSGTLVFDGTTYTLALPKDYHGTVTIDYTITDGNGGTVAQSTSATISDAPDLGLQAGGFSFTYEETSTLTGDNQNLVADFNNDGLLDIMVTNTTNGLLLGLNQGVATGGSTLFSYNVVTSNTSIFNVGDLNGDGFLDVVQRDSGSNRVDVFLNAGNGTFSLSDSVTQTYVTGMTVLDLNGDGHNDLLLMRSVGSGVEVFLGDGSGTFGTTPDQTPTAPGGTSLTTGDIDGDGDTDVIIGVWGGDSLILENVNGVLTPGATLDNHGTSSPATAGSMIDEELIDLDNDGDLDLFAANRYVEGYWYENDGAGNFTRHQLDSVTGERDNVLAADFDGDGDIDVLVSAYNSLQLWQNNGDGTFTDVIAGSGLPTNLYTYGSVGDLDGDGDIDVVLQNTSANLTVVYSNNLVSASSFSEGGGAVSPFATLTASDSDSNLTGATVMISVNFAVGDVLSYTSFGGVTGSYDAATGTLTLSGSASAADYQSVLRSVTFSNTTTTMGAGNRMVTAMVTDGTGSSDPISQLITVTLDATLNATAGIDSLDGGDGANVYVIGAGNFTSGDSITDSGSPGDVDVITLGAAGTFDLSAGTVTGIETLQMYAAGGDAVVLGGGADPQQFHSIIGGSGADSVSLADASSTLDLTGVSISSVETISTGAGNDTVIFDDVSKPGVGFVLDGDLSAVDSDTAVFHAQAENSTMDVSGISFTGIETVKMYATADVAADPSYTGLNVTLKGRDGGYDELYGGDGTDTLIATTGNDLLTGGLGADTFVLSANSTTTVADFSQGGGDTMELSNTQFGLGSSGTLAAADYDESATAMGGTAYNYGSETGSNNTGDGLVAIQNGSNVELWHTTALEAASTANSTLVATLSNVNTSALDNTNFVLAV
ncbi:cadherin-like domain-containing protein [Magnetospirillum sp. 64-120]|uniref:cadherin-like domain-containing protein n=1 Tax=Magnetospirillum sp. 64-120 TaxID=1895778 RepID=UPI00092C1790|nr:cadherin-like domain-containing protein [Magnetospirillum sp. 64-120]OJX74789.1 MAG: hypothetical protein BGO92_14715 [Magnetospirillum sp. 64-120]